MSGPFTDAYMLNSLDDSLTPVPTRILNVDEAYAETLDELYLALAEATRLHDVNVVERENVTIARTRVAELNREFERFQEQVRDVLIELCEEGSLDEDATQGALDALDLPGLKRTYNVEVTVKQSFTVEIEASSEDEASELVEERRADDLIDSHGDSYSWELEIDYVGEA